MSRIPIGPNGPRMLWIVDARTRVIDMHRPNQPMITLRSGDTLDGCDVLPGFTADVSAVFAVLDT